MFAGVVDGLSEACTAMKGCCEAGVTSNDDFASCTEDAVAMSNITIPDISGLVPGGVPDLDSVAAAGATTTTTETTIAAEEAGGETTATTTTAAPVTTAPETEATTPVLTGADKGTTSSSSAAASGKNVFDKVALAISLIGTSSVATLLLFV